MKGLEKEIEEDNSLKFMTGNKQTHLQKQPAFLREINFCH